MKPETLKIQIDRNHYAVIDKGNAWIAAFPWYVHHGRRTKYAQSEIGYMHRLIMSAPAHKNVDHINGNGLDNRISNLRLCSRSQNQWNQHVVRNGTSKYRGVCWKTKEQAWIAQIRVYGKRIYIGTFKHEIDAAMAYDKAALEYFGDYASPNFTDSRQPEGVND